MNVLTILTEAGTLKPEDATAIATESQSTQTPIEALLERKGVTQEAILQAVSKKYDIPYIEESVFTRAKKMVDIVVGNAKMKRAATPKVDEVVPPVERARSGLGAFLRSQTMSSET